MDKIKCRRYTELPCSPEPIAEGITPTGKIDSYHKMTKITDMPEPIRSKFINAFKKLGVNNLTGETIGYTDEQIEGLYLAERY